MAVKKVTMQDIADACGLSRNTVSKIFNGRGTVPDATRRAVMEKAEELGYGRFSAGEPAKSALHGQNIALFTSHIPEDYHFGTVLLPSFVGQLSRAGYTLTMYELTPEDLHQRRLPAPIAPEQTAGIMGIELFDKDYLDMLCHLGLPAIFVDAYCGANTSLLHFDLISMENIASTIALTQHVLSAGARRIGFVGDIDHCNSFHERWIGFCTALTGAGISLNRELCILERDDPKQYSDPQWLLEQLRKMSALPNALICANDFIAIHLMMALKQMGVSVPERVMVTGFDGTPQSAVVEPSLTTAQIPGAEIGRLAADILLERIENPNRPFRSTYVRTTPVWRDSTARK